MLHIYVNTWGNYNRNGVDGCELISLPMDDEELAETLNSISKKMPDQDPEWFVNDYEWDGEAFFKVDENEDLQKLNETCQAISTLDDQDQTKLLAILEAYTSDIDDAIDMLDNCIFYPGQDLEDVAYDIVNDCYDLPDFAKQYFDYSAFARDLGFDGYYETEYGVIC